MWIGCIGTCLPKYHIYEYIHDIYTWQEVSSNNRYKWISVESDYTVWAVTTHGYLHRRRGLTTEWV